MTRHDPSVIWSLRRSHNVGLQGGSDYVRTTYDGLLLYVNGSTINLDRGTARLLARRIVLCLEDTKA